MPRLPRASIQNILYYITSKGANEQNLFNDERDYRAYLELLKKCQRNHNFKLFAFTLLSEHLHLLIELKPGANISEIMQRLHNSYIKYYNHRYKKRGPLFSQRFKATYVEKAVYLLELTRYIHLNSQRLGLVSDPKDYSYSSYPLYLTTAQLPDVLEYAAPNIQNEIKEVLSYIQETEKEKAYKNFVVSGSRTVEYLDKALHRGGFLGSDKFVEEIRGKILVRSENSTDKRRNEPLNRYIDLLLAKSGRKYNQGLFKNAQKNKKGVMP